MPYGQVNRYSGHEPDEEENRYAGYEPSENRYAGYEPDANRYAGYEPDSFGRKAGRVAAAAFSPLGRVADVANRGLYASTAIESEFMPEAKAYDEQLDELPAWKRHLAHAVGPGPGGAVWLQQSPAEIMKRWLGAAGRGVTGKEKQFTSDLWAERYGMPEGRAEKFLRGAGGFAVDLARDPVTMLGIGTATSAGKVARATGKLAPTAYKQAQAGQRALLSWAGKPLVYGAPAFKPLSAGAGKFAGSTGGKYLAQAFKRGSTNPALNRMLQLIGGGTSEAKAGAQRFGWELTDEIDQMARATGKSFDDVGATIVDAIEATARPVAGGPILSRGGAEQLQQLIRGGGTVGQATTRETVETFIENALGADVVPQGTALVKKWRDRMAASLGEQLTSGLKLGDLGEGHVARFFTDEWNTALKGLRKKFPHLEWNNFHSSMNERIMTRDFTIRSFNEMMRPGGQGLRGIMPELPEAANVFFKKAIHDNPAYIGQRYLQGAARAVGSQELFSGIKNLDDVVDLGDVDVGLDAASRLPGYRHIGGIDELRNFAAPDELATEIERIAGIVRGDELTGVARLMDDFAGKFYDPAISWWKAWTLAPFPAYHTRNVVGNMWNCFLAGVHDPRVFHDAARIEMALWEPSTKFGHGFRDNAQRFLGRANLDDVARKYSFQSFDELSQAAHSRGIMGRGWMAAEVGHGEQPTNLMGRWFGRESSTIRGGMTIGTLLENNARLGLFLDQTRKLTSMGVPLRNAIDDAALTTKKFLFDYSDEGVTEFERKVLKRLMPFYTWTRNNVPLQLEYLVKRPGKFGMIEKARQAYQVAEPLGEMGPEPDERYMPGYMKQMYPWRMWQKEGMPPEYLGMERWLPAADIGRVLNPGQTIMDLLTPALKYPLEISTDYDFFRGERILGEDSQGHRKHWKRGHKGRLFGYEGQLTHPYVVHGLKQLRAVSELDWLLRGLGGEMSPKGTLTRLLMGKVYPYDERASKRWARYGTQRDIDEIEREIEKAKRAYLAGEGTRAEIERLKRKRREMLESR